MRGARLCFPGPVWHDRRLISFVLFGLVLLVSVLTEHDYGRLDLPPYRDVYDWLGPEMFRRVMIGLRVFASVLRIRDLRRNRGTFMVEAGNPRHPSFKRVGRPFGAGGLSRT